MLLLLAGCATLPQDVQRPQSSAKDGSHTALGALVGQSLPPDPYLAVSGFRLLASGSYALDARLALAQAAQQTLDLQYYLVANDVTGKQFLASLRDAAARGVRVRLLVDDFYTSGEDDLFSGLAAYPNIEIRLFNPIAYGRQDTATRVLMSLGELARINRRMHNKLFIADNQIAVSGGRNIGDEYFTRAGAASFVDLDVLSAGPIVAEQSAVFDEFWNSAVVYPLASIVAPPADAALARRQFDAAVRINQPSAALTPRDTFEHQPVSIELSTHHLELQQAIAHVLADSPEKAAGLNQDDIRQTVTWDIDQQISQAKSRILIVSPYLVPGREAMRRLREAAARGVKITLVTNSLEATDVPLVFVGYAKRRLELLKLGATIYELSQSVAQAHIRLDNFRSQLGHLHAKALVFDGARVFVGSMNMDGRSAHENTETGLILESPSIAAEVDGLIQRDVERGAYHVILDGDQLRWLSTVNGQTRVLTDEPGESVLEKAELKLLSPFAPDDLL